MALVPGKWGGRFRAPAETDTEIVISKGPYLGDGNVPPSNITMRDAKSGEPVALPPFEAKLWGRYRLFTPDVASNRTVDTTTWRADTTSITADMI